MRQSYAAQPVEYTDEGDPADERMRVALLVAQRPADRLGAGLDLEDQAQRAHPPGKAAERMSPSVPGSAAWAAVAPSAERHDRARVLCDLGAALRRANRRRDAREPLRSAVATATEAGAEPLARRARDELLAAGGRPRRDALDGVEALTASELPVAELAADGRANREIAADLVVTVRTVEFHLSRTYIKLGIHSREELAQALGR